MPEPSRQGAVAFVLVLVALAVALLVGVALLVWAGLILEIAGLAGPLDERLPRVAAGAVIALPLGCWLIAIALQRRNAGRTFQQQAAANRLSSRVLMVTLVGLLAAVGAIIGGSVFFEAEASLVGAGLAAVVGLFGVLLAQQDGVGMVLSSVGAQPIGDRRLQDVAAELALAAGISRPRLYVVEHPSLNAFAVGVDPDDAAIVVTRGLLDGLDREQLQGVVAHEVAHIRNLDSRYGLSVTVLVGLVVFTTDAFRLVAELWVFRGRDFLRLVAWLLQAFAPLFALLVQAAVSREREYLADATAVELTRNPVALERALEAVRGDPRPFKEANRGTQHLWFENPVKRGSDHRPGLFSTHPSIDRRIQRLRLLRGEGAVLAGSAAGGAMLERGHGPATAGSTGSRPADAVTDLGSPLAGIVPPDPAGPSTALVVAAAGPATGVAPVSPVPPAGIGGRVALAELGFALTFPRDWAWVRHSERPPESLSVLLGPAVGADVAEWLEGFARHASPEVPLGATAVTREVTPGGWCEVHLPSCGHSLEEHRAAIDQDLRVALAAFRVVVSDVALPAAGAVRADYECYQPGRPEALQGTHYLIPMAAGGCCHLAFLGLEAPVDRWLSIASTFERLPRQV